MKKLLLSTLMFFVSICGFGYDCEVDGIYYKLYQASQTAIVTYETSSGGSYNGVLHIPEEFVYRGTTYNVKSIDHDAFYNCGNLTEVVIPNSITAIGYNAFYGCSSLKDITIPNSVVELGSSAFYGCSSLTEMSIPNNLTVIDGFVFFGCSGLTKVVVPNSITKIGNYAFSGCSSLTEIIIPDNVMSIGESAFAGCSCLAEVTLPCNITSIDNYTFENCVSLTQIAIPGSVISIGRNAFSGCKNLTGLTIPNSVISIDSHAFQECHSLTEFTIPSSVTDIGYGAFSDCISLRELNFSDGNDVLKFASYSGTAFIFTNCPIEKIYLGRDIDFGSSYYTTFKDMTSINSLVIGDCVTSIGSCGFSGCSGLKELTIGSNVTLIDGSAFSDCSGIEKLTISNSVRSIGGYAFSGCSNLKALNIPSNVMEIGNSAFSGCSSLTEVTIQDGTDVLEFTTSSSSTPFSGSPIQNLYMGRNISYNSSNSPFKNKTSLTNLVLGSSVTSIGNSAFYGCTSLAGLNIPYNVTKIDDSAFDGCNSLTEFTIPNNVMEIGSSAFANCISLTEVSILDSTEALTFTASSSSTLFSGSPVEKLYLGRNINYNSSYSPFKNMLSMTSLVIGNKVTSIGNSSFNGCSSLNEVIISDGTSILEFITSSSSTPFSGDPIEKLYMGRDISYNSSYSPFKNMKSMTDLSFGDNVSSIGNSAFSGCVSLTELTIPDGVTEIGSSAFSGCSNLIDLTIGYSVCSIGYSAFNGCKEYKIVSYAPTPPVLNEALDAISLEVPNQTTYLYAKNENWGKIKCIYTMQDNIKLYPVIVYQEGNGFTIGEEQNDLEVAENSILEVKPTAGMEKCYLVLYNGKDITERIMANGFYSFTSSKFHGENVIKTSVYPLTAVTEIESGTLLDVIGVENVDSIYFLKVSGELNGTDILAIRKMSNLRLLDMEETSIVNGGQSYYQDYVTSANVIGDYFFQDKTNLTKIILPKSILSIGRYAFSGMSNLASISIPKFVTSIGTNVFDGCKSLETLVLEDENKKLTFSSSLSSCPVKYLYLGRDVSGNLLQGKTTLKYLTIGDSITVVYNSSFSGCSSLTELTIGNNVKEIGNYAFRDCSSLPIALIPNNVTLIGSSSFENCINLTEISIGSNVTSIGNDSFKGCFSLISVISLNTTPPVIVASTFDETTEQNATLHVPEGCKTIYWLHPYWENFFSIQDDVLTDIKNVKVDRHEQQTKNDAIYTVGGVKLNTTTLSGLSKGIYIINGKKISVK